MEDPVEQAAGQRTPSAAVTEQKRLAAEYAVRWVESGMVVGLGTGSTAIFATRRIGALLREGTLRDIVCIATSRATEDEARQLAIPLLDESLDREVDLTIDGADEVDPEMDLVKGGGGALLREKIVAVASHREVIVVDETKLSPRLGTRFRLPVEVVPFGWRSQARFLESLGARPELRRGGDGHQFRSDQGNVILDCDFGPIPDKHALANSLSGRAGIVEHGLFLGIATDLVIAGASGVRCVRRDAR